MSDAPHLDSSPGVRDDDCDFEPLTVSVPLREDPSGVIRVGESRVLLEIVLDAFKRGESPEAIVRSFKSLRLPDVSAAI
jgi:hypothetical protein